MLDRLRSKNVLLSHDPGDAPATPYQNLCCTEYADVAPILRPSHDAFLPYDPARSRAKWRHDPPVQLCPDIRTDSALDIVRKLQMKSNGGTRIIDSHAATVTDQFVKSEWDVIASPNTDGAQYVVKSPPLDRSEKTLAEIEAHPDVTSKVSTNIRPGDRVVCTALGKLALGQRPILGEKAARVFEPGDSIPHLATPDGGRLNAFASLAMRHEDPVAVHSILAKELRLISGIDMPEEYIETSKEYAGDPFIRASAMGDRKYHALASHPSQAGCCAIRVAPMTSESYGLETPPPWQSLRTGLRSIGHLNLSLDPYARAIAFEDAGGLQLGYDVAGDTLAPFQVSAASIVVMAFLQSEFPASRAASGVLTTIATKRVIDAVMYTQGGVRDLLEFSQVKAELDAVWQESEDVLEEVPTQHHLRLQLSQGNVEARSAIIRPAITLTKGKTKDDVETRLVHKKHTAAGFTREAIAASDLGTVDSIGALMRYAVSICYMQRKPEVKLAVAMYVKQWNVSADGRSWRVARTYLAKNALIKTLAVALFTPDVCNLMRRLLPFCSIGSVAEYLRLGHQITGVRLFGRKDEKSFEEITKAFVGSDGAFNERFSLRRMCGRLLWSGMSDSGLMFSISTGITQKRHIADVVMEHVRYKIDVWKNNYLAQLKLVKVREEDVTNEKFEQMVLWQQKLSMLKAIELMRKGDIVHVFVRNITVCKVLLESYSKRHKTIERRIEVDEAAKKNPKKDKRRGIWKRDDHPWGPVASDEEKGALIVAGVDATLGYLRSKDMEYWVIDPDKLYTQVNRMVEQVVTEVRTAIEGSNIGYDAEVNGELVDYKPDLPADTEAELSAKFVFSLADPPSARRGTPTLRGAGDSASLHPGKLPPRTPPNLSLLMPRSGRPGLGGAKRVGLGGLKVKGVTSAAPKMATVLDILGEAPPDVVQGVCSWLTRISNVGITPTSSSASLPKKYHCYPPEAAVVRATLVTDYELHLVRQLEGKVDTVEIVDDMV